jgi:hypothetical protein
MPVCINEKKYAFWGAIIHIFNILIGWCRGERCTIWKNVYQQSGPAINGSMDGCPSWRKEPLMRSALILLSVAVMLVDATVTKAFPSHRTSGLSNQAHHSWSKKKLDSATAYAKEIGSAVVLVLHDGQVVFSYGDIRGKYMCHSIRKPFLGALYGIYVGTDL